jgi:magnesium transporter
MLKVFRQPAQGPFEETSDVGVLKALPVVGDYLWVDLENPTEEDAVVLSEVFNFHPLAIEDCFHDSGSPKVDDYNDYVFIVVHGIRYDESGHDFSSHELNVFLGPNYLVTFHSEPSLSIRSAEEYVRRNPALMQQGSDFLLHYIVDRLVDNYFPKLEIMEDRIEEIEAAAFEDPSEDVLTAIFKTRRQLTQIRRVVGHEREVLVGMSRGTTPFVGEKARFYFRDVYDHMLRITEMTDLLRDTINIILQAYLSMVSNRLNNTMRVLTVIATMMLPMTVITGIYGMNFRHMPELGWNYGYYYVLGGMLLISLGMLYFFRKRKWL